MFSTRYRLLRKFLNSVLLRTLLYDGTACSQKTKNAKKAVSIKLTAFLKPHRQHFVLPPPLINKRRLIWLLYFGVLQELYRAVLLVRVAVRVLTLPSPRIFAHFFNASFSFPAKFLESFRRVAVASCNVACSAWFD